MSNEVSKTTSEIASPYENCAGQTSVLYQLNASEGSILFKLLIGRFVS